MKSIKNQYIALKEGKMTEAQFMRNVRMTLPEYISNVTLFKQAERILINKGIISEIKINEETSDEKIERFEKYKYTLDGKSVKPDEIAFYNNILKAEIDGKIYKIGIPQNGVVELNPTTGKTGIYTEVNKSEKSNNQPLPEDGSTIKVGNTQVKIEYTGKNKDIIGYSWKDENGKDNYEETSKLNHKNLKSLNDTIKDEIRHQRIVISNRKSPIDEAEKSNKQKLIDAGYSESDAEDFADEFEQGGVKVPQKVKDILNEATDLVKILRKVGWFGDNWTPQDYAKQIKNLSDSTLKIWYDSAKNNKGIPNTPLAFQQKLTKIEMEKRGLIESLKEAKDGYYNQDGKEQYGKFDELDNMNAQEIMAGYVLEKIDNPDKDKKEIVKLVIKNLKKDQFYYTNYKLTGTPGEKPVEFTSTKRKPGFDQMEELDKKSTNLTDEKNKMQVVKEGLEIQEGYQKGDKVTFTNKNSDKIYKGTVVQDLGDGKFTFTSAEDSKIYNNKQLGNNWKISKEVVEIQEEIEDTFNESDYDESDFKDDTKISEVQKTKLKEMVRKMMKEIGDGRNNLTDIDEIEEKPTKLTTKQLNIDTVKYLKKNADVIAKSIISPGVPYIIKPTQYNDGINIMVKDLRSTPSPDYENFMKITITVTQSTGFKYGNDLFSSDGNTTDITGGNI